jgi:hypothetical protein
LLGEGGGLVGTAGPVSAYSQIEEDEERMVEDPVGVGGEIGGGVLDDEVVVEEELDVIGGPLDGVEMKAGGNGFAGGEG